MTGIQIGDRVSIELIVTNAADIIEARLPFRDGVSDLAWEGISAHRTFFTILRRAPVDLATCELPVEVVWYSCRCRLEWRGPTQGVAITEDGREIIRPLAEFRPLDAPAPESEVERLRARIELYRAALDAIANSAPALFQANSLYASRLKRMAHNALADPASDKKETFEQVSAHMYQEAIDQLNGTKRPVAAPTCPPGHIMIGDRAVPEPMPFSAAMHAVEHGRCVRRDDWGRPAYIERAPDGAMAYLRMVMKDGKIGPYTPSQCDMTTDDWRVISSAEALIAMSAGEGV